MLAKMTSLPEIERKLQALREEWKSKPAQGRQILLRRARALEIAKEKLLKK